MKKSLASLAVAVCCIADGQTNQPVFLAGWPDDLTGAAPLPVTNTDDYSTLFWAGVTLGLTWGGVAWQFRVVRQAAKQNPEI
jgi:hypothetical protein